MIKIWHTIDELPSLSNKFRRTNFELSDSYNTLLDVRLVGDDVDVDGHEEPEGAVAKRDGCKELRPLRGRADDPRPVGEHHLELAADVLEKRPGLSIGNIGLFSRSSVKKHF